jgi:hypothetical protein
MIVFLRGGTPNSKLKIMAEIKPRRVFLENIEIEKLCFPIKRD